jgi:hypothetical protein
MRIATALLIVLAASFASPAFARGRLLQFEPTPQPIAAAVETMPDCVSINGQRYCKAPELMANALPFRHIPAPSMCGYLNSGENSHCDRAQSELDRENAYNRERSANPD